MPSEAIRAVREQDFLEILFLTDLNCVAFASSMHRRFLSRHASKQADLYKHASLRSISLSTATLAPLPLEVYLIVPHEHPVFEAVILALYSKGLHDGAFELDSCVLRRLL